MKTNAPSQLQPHRSTQAPPFAQITKKRKYHKAIKPHPFPSPPPPQKNSFPIQRGKPDFVQNSTSKPKFSNFSSDFRTSPQRPNHNKLPTEGLATVRSFAVRRRRYQTGGVSLSHRPRSKDWNSLSLELRRAECRRSYGEEEGGGGGEKWGLLISRLINQSINLSI